MLEIIVKVVGSILVWGIGILLIVSSIQEELRKMKIEKNIENSKETLDRDIERAINGDTKSEKIYFYPDKKTFINKNKGVRITIVSISTLLVILALFGCFYAFYCHNNYTGIVLQISSICLFGSIFGFIYYAARYYDRGEGIFHGKLYFDTNKNILFLDTDLDYYSHFFRGKRLVNLETRKIRFGLSYVRKVKYSIDSVSHILVDKDEIVLFGNIIMTSFDSYTDNDEYLNYVQFDDKVNFNDGGKYMQMFSKRLEMIKIPRGYGGFEKFLISKQYSGSEKLK